jgi:AcrR family transcriptional regulator
LLAATVSAVDELGCESATVADITGRARISRRTFYELFSNREECLAAVLEDAAAVVRREIAAADLGGSEWLDRVRGGLRVILSFFDREPELARVCVVQAPRGGPLVLACREEILAELVEVVDDGRNRSAGASCTALTAEGLIGAGLAIVHLRLSRAGHGPLIELLSELMGMIALPYLGVAAARREQARSVPAQALGSPVGPRSVASDPLGGVAMRLTYRTARVLECVAEIPRANNRQVAERAGISDQGQVSKLLARLARLGLLANEGKGHAKGEPNAWSLTPKGESVVCGIQTHASPHRRAA